MPSIGNLWLADSVESEECVLGLESEVRPLTADDVPWMVEMMASRRALYETFSPVFWKPSPNAREVHRPYLASCMTSDRHCGFRTDDAFILGEAQDAGAPPWWSDVTLGFVDDFAVTGGASWADAGATLLRAAWRELARRGVATLRVVTRRRDTPKVAMLESVGLTVGESWWIVLAEGESSPDPIYGPITRDGVEGLNIPAPPVYDAKRPALLVTSIHPHAVQKLPAIAAELGAGLAIVPTKPADENLIAAVGSSGFDEVTLYYVGKPSGVAHCRGAAPGNIS